MRPLTDLWTAVWTAEWQNANKIIRIDLDGNFSTYLEDTNRPIGLAYDGKGRLIATQSRAPRVGVLTPTRTTLAEAFEGQPLVRPNDLVIDKKGGIYFTDPLPNPGTGFREPPPGRKPLLFYITPQGTLTKLTEYVTAPNGVQLSLDEKTLYAVNGDHIGAFDVQTDGSVKNPRRFAETPGDGMMVDSEGRLCVAVMTGIQVVSPQGRLLGLIPAPGRIPSFTFAGKDKKTVYAVGAGAVYRIPMLAAGVKGRAK
jgi:gluconolactonase